jgi:type III secretion protein V
VDTLIALNMTISAVLLMVAMYLPSPLAFSLRSLACCW